MDSVIDRVVDDYDRGRLSRRQLIAHLAALAGAAAGAPALAQGAAAGEPTFKAVDLNHIALSVTDIDRSRDFYMRHLGLELASQGGGSCFLRCRQRDFVALFKAQRPAMDHYCFAIETYDAAAAVERLKAAGITARRHDDRVYFDDPDGLEVQVAATDHRV
jgi:catechol 2,3-dioxygenase-like lactoylglutathione lyase family enzyme